MVWHSLTLEQIFKALKTTDKGLTAEEAEKRRAEYGSNELPAAPPDTMFAVFARQFYSPLIVVLIVAAVIVLFMGETADAALIFAVLVFNALIGAVQEGKAQQTLQALKKLTTSTARVVRNGAVALISSRDLVPGDIIELKEGDKVPADARLIHSAGIMADEAPLTGESVPVGKTVKEVEEKAPVTERVNMVFKGTHITKGSALAVVVATGVHTQIGSISKSLTQSSENIPLKQAIERLTRVILYAVFGICMVVVALGILRGIKLQELFAVVVSLAVSAVPEGLPVVLTVVLATGVWRMGKRNALVKKLQAVEALGHADIIATDKTGTLTLSELTVRSVIAGGKEYNVEGLGYLLQGGIERVDGTIASHEEDTDLFALARYSCIALHDSLVIHSQHHVQVDGDPTDGAIAVFAHKVLGNEAKAYYKIPKTYVLPFDFEHKMQGCVIHEKGKKLAIFIGAVERILHESGGMLKNGKYVPLSLPEKRMLGEEFARMHGRGMRLIALSIKEGEEETITYKSVAGSTLVGVLGLQDVLRPDAKDAIKKAHGAGIAVVMITGDHALTAAAIARELGLPAEKHNVLTGQELNELTDKELAHRLPHIRVFARVTPQDKLRIVKAYTSLGLTVAMTGDGVNDAPSLAAAHLGIAMGKKGTEVAKEAADIVLLDDSFASIVAAIEEGRSMYKTILKVITYLFTTNLGEAFAIILALFLGMPVPILASQIIWLNFVTDGAMVAPLAVEPKERGVLTRYFGKPTPYLLTPHLIARMLVLSLTMALVTLAVFSFYLQEDYAKAWTMSLTTLAAFQWFNAWNVRHETYSMFSPKVRFNPWLLVATLIAILLHVIALYTPFMQNVLHTVPLNASDWYIALIAASSIIIVDELGKIGARLSRR